MDRQLVFEKIEKFLLGKLEGDELELFMAKQKKEQTLAEQVDIHREMGKALKHSPEDELRANLGRLGRQYQVAMNRKRALSVFAFILIVGFALSWILKKSNVDATEFNDVESNESPVFIEQESAPIQESVPHIQPPPAAPSEDKPKEKSKGKDEKVSPSSLPIAANFEPNTMLVTHIGNAIRGGNYEFELILPRQNQALSINQNECVFQFSGLLKANKASLNDDFQVHLFSNKKKDYENFHPIFTLPLVFEKKEKGFVFDVIHQQKLPKGLYYYLLEDANSGEMIKVGKVFNR